MPEGRSSAQHTFLYRNEDGQAESLQLDESWVRLMNTNIERLRQRLYDPESGVHSTMTYYSGGTPGGHSLRFSPDATTFRGASNRTTAQTLFGRLRFDDALALLKRLGFECVVSDDLMDGDEEFRMYWQEERSILLVVTSSNGYVHYGYMYYNWQSPHLESYEGRRNLSLSDGWITDQGYWCGTDYLNRIDLGQRLAMLDQEGRFLTDWDNHPLTWEFSSILNDDYDPRETAIRSSYEYEVHMAQVMLRRLPEQVRTRMGWTPES